MTSQVEHVVVVGLGYVGLPLAVALAKSVRVTGLDIDRDRIAELRDGHDSTGEIDRASLEASSLYLTGDPADCRGADIFIVTVPTPVDEEKRPDLRAVINASHAVGAMLTAGKDAIVVYESTVYPGVTEDICGPLLEKASGLRRGSDFFLGYSPERINPGDREHSVDRIIKVVAGESPEVTERLVALYGRVTSGGVYKAKSIKVAEAAKVIENAQRDINIAFINEITRIFSKLEISIWDVLEAAGTKWNFLNFQPGLVGGHCIGVDPYYLSFRAQELGENPNVILAGRSINDGMGVWIADQVHRRAGKAGTALVLGLTFKENVPDLRNSRVIDVIERLLSLGHDVAVHDPLADAAEASREYDVRLDPEALLKSYDLVVAAVAHDQYRAMTEADLSALLNPGGLFADLKNIHGDIDLGAGRSRWSL